MLVHLLHALVAVLAPPEARDGVPDSEAVVEPLEPVTSFNRFVTGYSGALWIAVQL